MSQKKGEGFEKYGRVFECDNKQKNLRSRESALNLSFATDGKELDLQFTRVGREICINQSINLLSISVD